MLQAREATYDQEQQKYGGGNSLEKTQSRGRGKSPARGKHAIPKRRKHKVVLHTSPFIRCVQTSIAIGAGLSQYQGLQHEAQAAAKQSETAVQERTRKVSTKSSTTAKSPLHTIKDDEDGEIQKDGTPDRAAIVDDQAKPSPKIKLRLDAFLGEWLTPEYYESITHPPDSRFMLAGVKSELLRRGDYVEGPELPTESKKGYGPGLWGSPNLVLQNTAGTPSDISNLSLKSPIQLSKRDRASTFGSVFAKKDKPELSARALPGGYVPPTPRYAISPLDPIPKGYVAHARDACVDVDYQWDSTRPPSDWGDGGTYGEEWSSMHKRFRNGIQKMVHWYRIHQTSALRQTGHPRNLHPIHPGASEDEDTDTVLILVTHGAGCNALIGALTDQPVLLDVGMASLTMAIYKEKRQEDNSNANPPKPSPSSPFPSSSSSPPRHRQPQNPDNPLSAEYIVVITASVEHLRADSTPLTIPLLQNPSLQLQADFPSLSSQPSYRPTRSATTSHSRYRLSNSSMVTQSPIDLPTTHWASTWRQPSGGSAANVPSSGGREDWLGGGGSTSGASAATAAAMNHVRSNSAGLWAPPVLDKAHAQSVVARAETAREEKHEYDAKATMVADDGERSRPPPTREGTAKGQVPTMGPVAHGEGKEGEDKEGEEEGNEAEEDENGGESELWGQSSGHGQTGLRNPVRPEVRERWEGPKRRWTINDQ